MITAVDVVVCSPDRNVGAPRVVPQDGPTFGFDRLEDGTVHDL